MELLIRTPEDTWKWYDGFDGGDIFSIRWEVFQSFSKNKDNFKGVKGLLDEVGKTLEYLSKEDKVKTDNLGLYNPDTDKIEPLSKEKCDEIFALPNFTQVVLHYYKTCPDDCLLSIREETFYTLNGNLYNDSMLHKFVGLYRYDFISRTLYEDIINKLKKDYNIEYDDRIRHNLPFIFTPFAGYSDAYSQYNIHIDIYRNKIMEGTDLSRGDDLYEPNDDLKYLERLNNKLFDGNKDTYKYFKNMLTRNDLDLEYMYTRTPYELAKKVYLLEHDSDYSCLEACKINFAAFNRNIKAIKKYLDDIDERFYKLSGKHILKKIKK